MIRTFLSILTVFLLSCGVSSAADMSGEDGGPALLSTAETGESGKWTKGEVDEELKFGGLASIRFGNSAVPEASLKLPQPVSIEGFQSMRFQIHSQSANGQKVVVAFFQTGQPGCHYRTMTMDFSGWKTRGVPLDQLTPDSQAGEKPLTSFDRVVFSTNFFPKSMEPLPDTLLHIDDICLVK